MSTTLGGQKNPRAVVTVMPVTSAQCALDLAACNAIHIHLVKNPIQRKKHVSRNTRKELVFSQT